MKKILPLFLFCLMVFMSNAQRFEGGILAGFNGTQVDGDFTHGYHKPGALLGAYVQTNLSRVVYAGMEIKYSQKGSRKNPDAKKEDQEKYIMRLGYMDVPFYLGFRTSEAISFIAGLSAGYLMHSGEWDNFGKFQKEDERPFNEFDFQALLGTRFELTGRLRFDLRFAYSLVPIRDLPVVELWYWRNNQFNNVISTSLYYRLGK
jgi:opacity protein-like surface antigen